jgi:hypothetical protein
VYPQGKDNSTHWKKGWVGPRGGLDVQAKRKIKLVVVVAVVVSNIP